MRRLYYYLLLLVAVSSQLVEVLGAAPSIELDEKSYRIVATLFLTNPDKRNYVYEVQEDHSAWQKRSRISYRYIGLPIDSDSKVEFPNKATLYADERDLLVRNEEADTCQQEPHEFADKLFSLNQVKQAKSPSIVGPSRLLHFAEANKNNLRAHEDIQDMDRYSYAIPGQNSICYLYYFKETSRNPANGVPAQVSLVVGSADYVLSYEFKRVDIIPNQPLFGWFGLSRQYNAYGAPITLEWLTIEPFTGCDNVLRKTSATSTDLLRQDLRFSFEARLGSRSTFVGYEPSIRTLRVDRLTETRSTKTLTNFHTGLNYHLVRRRAEQDYVLDKLVEVQGDKKLDDDLLCVVTKAVTSNATAQSFPLGSMLFGSSELAYLGMAQVRGIEARAYLAYKSEWPIWIQQPAEYHTSPDWILVSKSTRTRPTVDQDSDLILSTLIYLTYTEQEEDQFSGKLLRMEFHTIDKNTKQQVGRRTYEIYDFSWSFSGDSPTGLNSEQFYSLGDSCSSPSSEDNHYGQIDLLMQYDLNQNEADTSVVDWLAHPRKRNFAIMKAAQETSNLPASIVYDIESRYQISTTSEPVNGLQKGASVAASLRLVEHMRSIVQLIYIGRGGLEPGQGKNFRIFDTVSFQSCYLIASHRKVGLVFAFDPRRIQCLVYTKSQVIGNVKSTILDNFQIYRDGYLEVYRIRHVNNVEMEDELGVLTKSNRRLTRYSKLHLVDPTDENNQVYVDLKWVETSELNEKTTTQVDELGFSDSNKFIGFGLVASDRHNRLIEPKRLSTRGWTEQDAESRERFAHILSAMNFGQCRAACLADFECESFSVCVKSAQLECILSKVSFRSEVLVLQLLQTLDTATQLNAELKLMLADGAGGEVKVKRHPGCELHNKLYSDFFIQSARDIRVNLLQRFLRPVSQSEDCSKMCLERTLSTIRDEVEEARRASWTLLNEPETDLDSFGQLYKEYKQKHREICSTFYYLEQSDFLAFSKVKQSLLERQMVGRNENELTNGYCIMGASLTDAESQAWKETNGGQEPDKYSKLEVSVSRHRLDFTALFEQQHGVSLAESSMDGPELAAYQELLVQSAEHSVTREQFKALKGFVQRGENIVSPRTFPDAASCARLCFQQQVPIWPACRSFDVVELESYTSRVTHCFFNSITVADAFRMERFDLVRDKPNDQDHVKNPLEKIIKVVHYEPRNDLIASSLLLAGQLSMDESYLEQVAPSSDHDLQMGYFGLFVTVVLALAFGVSFGVLMGLRVLIPRLQVKADDVESLVEPFTFEFSNLVNFEGRIPEPAIDQEASQKTNKLQQQQDLANQSAESVN